MMTALDFDPELAESDLYLAVDTLREISRIARAAKENGARDPAFTEIEELALTIIDALNKSDGQ